jgi:F-type H+-transporting ATPase subunit delta
MRPSATARRYAEAAFDVARQDGEVGRWLDDLSRVSDTLANPSAGLYFKDPNVPAEEKLATLRGLFPEIPPHIANLLRMLAERERLHLLPAILAEFQSLDREARGVLEAQVTVARPFDLGEQEEIKRRLSAATGKTVEIHLAVDPAILGGIVVRIGDRLIDASVSGRLSRLRHQLAV